MKPLKLNQIEERARFIRIETIKLNEIAKCGHYSSVFSSADILATLYYHTMNLSDDPNWIHRDRLILSKGHVAAGVYPILADLGYFPKNWLDNYAHLGSSLGDHPDMRKIPGIDFSSGSLGHGLSIGQGMALGLKKISSEARVYVLMGDGELNEGQVWEAAQSAKHFKSNNLIGIIDRNRMQLDGLTDDVMDINPIAEKWESFGWDVHHCNGHSIPDLIDVFDKARNQKERPQIIICDTTKGKGVKLMETSRVWHLGYLHGKDAEAAIQEIMTKGGEPSCN